MAAGQKMCTDVSNTVQIHNDLIRGKSDLSLNEIKLLRMAIMQVVKEDTDFQTYTIGIIELAKALGIASENLYRDVQINCEHLLKELVYVGDGNPKHKWRMFHWVSSCSYNKGIITIKLSDDLKPYLIQLTGLYTQYILEDVLKLKSVYAIRLYELILEAARGQRGFGKKEVTVYISMDTIRKATSTEDKYSQAGSFKQYVIDAPLKEINEKLASGDTLRNKITVNGVREGYKIVGYNFTLSSRWKK